MNKNDLAKAADISQKRRVEIRKGLIVYTTDMKSSDADIIAAYLKKREVYRPMSRKKGLKKDYFISPG